MMNRTRGTILLLAIGLAAALGAAAQARDDDRPLDSTALRATVDGGAEMWPFEIYCPSDRRPIDTIGSGKLYAPLLGEIGGERKGRRCLSGFDSSQIGFAGLEWDGTGISGGG